LAAGISDFHGFTGTVTGPEEKVCLIHRVVLLRMPRWPVPAGIGSSYC
jgi:hypothetical protein